MKSRAFYRYFFKFMTGARTKQRAFFLSCLGLALSSFSLLVLQCTMGGLQHNLIKRSKDVIGLGVVKFNIEADTKLLKNILDEHKNSLGEYTVEFESELLLKNGNTISPVLAHGMLKDLSNYPDFFKNNFFEQSLLAIDLGYSLGVYLGQTVSLLGPVYVDEIFGDIPREQSFLVEKFVETKVPELDRYHLWIRGEILQNLARSKTANKIRLYSRFDPIFLRKIFMPFGPELLSWEQQNQSLVWALSLESMVMLVLFISMSILIGVSITSALHIFFSKLKWDLASFWLLGASEKNLKILTERFVVFMSLASVTLGIVLAFGFLYLFDLFGGDIMPDIFIERKIPVHYSVQSFLIALLVPSFFALIFSINSLKTIKQEDESYLEKVRSLC